MRKLAMFLVLAFIGANVYSQTWLEKDMNGLQYGTTDPPTGSPNLYSEPFDYSWRNGYVGIGTSIWPLTKLQVHVNDNINTELNTVISAYGGDPTAFSSIFTNGGTTTTNTVAAGALGFTSRDNVTGGRNYGLIAGAFGNNLGAMDNGQVAGIQATGVGDDNDEVIGVSGVAIGNDNNAIYAVIAKAEGSGQSVGTYGVFATAESVGDANSVNVGVDGAAHYSPAMVNVGVHGQACGASQFNAGIWGVTNCTDSSETDPTFPTGSFAGYFDGNVFVTGNVYLPSDRKLKQNIEPLGTVTDKLSRVKVYSYNFRPNTGLSLPHEKEKEYGVISQELQEVFPEIVHDLNVAKHGSSKGLRDIDQVKAVEYGQLVPLLLKSVQELNERIKVLEGGKGKASSALASSSTTALAGQAELSSNEVYLKVWPNPSNNYINVEFPNVDMKESTLLVTDLAGKVIKQYRIDSREPQRLYQSDYGNGVFLCNLITNGKVAESVRIAFTD